MKILIADDYPDVLENFERAIAKLGHIPILCRSLAEASAVIADAHQLVDIAFIDNHFASEGFGIDRVRDFRWKKPDMDIIVTTKRDVRPDLVSEIINLEVGFFKKQSDDPTLLEAELSQRINIRRSKDEALRRKLADLQRASEGAKEGIRRLLQFSNEGGTKRKTSLIKLDPTNQRLIVPRFERFQTIQVDQQSEVIQRFEFGCAGQLKAATKLEFGLGIDESRRFFESSLGREIIQKLESEHSYESNAVLKGTLEPGQKLSLSDIDLKKKIRKREYYRGVEHIVYKAVIEAACTHCGLSDLVDLRIFAPTKVVEVSVAFDKEGLKVADEDQRVLYHEFPDS